MPLTACNQKAFSIESKLSGFFLCVCVGGGGGFCYIWLDLEIFIGETGDEVK